MTPNLDVITGRQLDEFLDRAEADFGEDSDPPDSSQIQLLQARLRAQPLRAHSLEAVTRLHALWMNAGDPATARAVLDTDGASVLAGAPQNARAEIRLRLALYRLQIAYFLREEDAMRRALAEMRHTLAEAPGLHAEGYRELYLLNNIERFVPACAVDAIDLLHALHRAAPNRAQLRAWDDADHARRRALAYQRRNLNAEAAGAAEAAFSALQNAAPDQQINEGGWLNIGNALIEIAPDYYPAIAQAVTRLSVARPLPQRREMEVRIARLSARAVHAREGAAAALVASGLARHCLSAEGGDDFIEHELPWLIEANRIEEAGQRAFFDIYERDTEMWPGTARIVHERLADGSDVSAWWALCVMAACLRGTAIDRLASFGRTGGQDLKARSPVHAELFASFGQLRGADFRQAVYEATRALAKRRAPGHPWIDRLVAEHDGLAAVIDPETEAARLQEAIERGGMTDNLSLYALFTARKKAFGLVAALKFATPSPTNGMWAYRYAAAFDDDPDALMADVPTQSRDDAIAAMERLKTQYYEQGLAYVTRFFETGQGHPYDGCAHLYSSLCYGLGICYTEAKRYNDALDLHRRGLEASPFADHYAWMIKAQNRMGDYAAVVETGEQLWDFSTQYGFGNHTPNSFVGDIVWSLSRLERDDEMPIWLERLVKWQREEQHVDEAKLPDEALRSRMYLGIYLATMRPNEATALWDGLKTQIEASHDRWAIANAASTLYYLGRYNESRAIYERLLRMNDALPESERFDAQLYETRIASCIERAAEQAQAAQAAAARKPWWRFWP